MTTTVRAVYEGGVLRPVQPLPLDEGEAVDVTVSRTKASGSQPSNDEIARRLKAATSIAEWVEATKLLPADDGEYDIVQALNENRIWSGERPLIPDERATP
jgi:predicted DNA-binding antitoxin AbrB/MazE fold protein